MLLYKEYLQDLELGNVEFILAPSICYLPLFKAEDIILSVQNININQELGLTGDVSIEQLKSLNVKYTIVGHYEQKKYYNETERDIIQKIQMALKAGLKVIYCIGETYEELSRKVEYQILEKAIARVLNHVPVEEFENIIIAYEPTYMIGGGKELNINKITDNIEFIKHIIDSYYHSGISVVYGGNITPENIAKFKKIKCLDGVILGGSSENPEKIKQILEEIKS